MTRYLGACVTGGLDAYTRDVMVSGSLHLRSHPGPAGSHPACLLPGWQERGEVAEDAFPPHAVKLVGHGNGRCHTDCSRETLGCLAFSRSYKVVEILGNTFYFGSHRSLSFQKEIPGDF